MKKDSIVYTNDNCIGCNKCISVCSAIGACVSSVENGKPRITVDGNRCVACGVCANQCPREAISIYKGCYAVVDVTKCVGCGICEKACPFGAITMQ